MTFSIFFPFLYGAILAFGLILPLGPQNLFVFSQGVSQPTFFKSLPCALSAFLCDAILILLAVTGVSLLVLNLTWFKIPFFSLGFLFLIYIGWITWRTQPQTLNVNHSYSMKHQILMTASVSLLNPHALLDTIATIGTNAIRFSGAAKEAYTVGCMLISFLWFMSLALLGRTLNKLNITEKYLRLINKISALIIWSVAVYIGYTFYKML